jgi:hypothetical protein
MSNKVGLLITRQTTEQLCNGLRTYCDKHNIKTITELEEHNTTDKFIMYQNSSRILGENINLDILFINNQMFF